MKTEKTVQTGGDGIQIMPDSTKYISSVTRWVFHDSVTVNLQKLFRVLPRLAAMPVQTSS